MKMKRIWSALLSLAMILSMIPAMSIGASAARVPSAPTCDIEYDPRLGVASVTLTNTDDSEGYLLWVFSEDTMPNMTADYLWNNGYYKWVDEGESKSFSVDKMYLYYTYFAWDNDVDDYLPGEVCSAQITLPVPEINPTPAISDAVAEPQGDGSVNLTMQVEPLEEIAGIEFSYYVTYEYSYVNNSLEVCAADDYTATINLKDPVTFRYCASVMAKNTETENTRLFSGAWKTCEVTAEPMPESTAAGTGARTATDDAGNVYLGGNYIEVGLSKHGSFGTVNGSYAVPENFHTYWFQRNTSYALDSHGDSLGLIVDGDGWNQGEDPIDGDFFVPGSPYECWSFCYQIDLDEDGICETNRVLYVADLSEKYSASHWSVEPVTAPVDLGENKLGAETVATTLDGVEIKIEYSFGVDDLYYTTDVTVVNNSGKLVENAFYGRDFDPDQDQWITGEYDTYTVFSI